MGKKTTEVPGAEFPAPPLFFADQPSALMLGPHVSRITFGVEELDDGDFPRPVVTLAMPTIALLQFVNDTKKALDAPSFKKHTIERLEKAARSIASGGGTTPVSQAIEVTRKPQTRRARKPT